MAQFLTTTGISYQLEEIIKSAEERLVIISPFLRINERVKELLEDKDRLKVDIRVVYGKKELQPDQDNWLESMSSIRTSFCKNLHAKCYLNESQALLTSMNLYEFSQVNNHEMGMLVVREDERELYDEILRESMRIVRISDEIRVKVARVDPVRESKHAPRRTKARRKAGSSHSKPEHGFCVRCREAVPFNSAKPYCKGCYMIWKGYNNDNYKEKYCHACGKGHVTTRLRPVCRSCYKKYKRFLTSLADTA